MSNEDSTSELTDAGAAFPGPLDSPVLVDDPPDAAPEAPDASTEPQTLAEQVMGIWTLGGGVTDPCKREEYWWFHTAPRLEHILVETGCVDPGRIQTNEDGEYVVEGRTLTTSFAGRRERFVVAHGRIDDTRVIHLHSFVPASETSYETRHVLERFGSDGAIDGRSELVVELAFEQPIPIGEDGDCAATARYEVITYERWDSFGNEKPAEERETVVSATSEPVACSHSPSEYGQEIRLKASFFDEGTLPDSLAGLLQDVMWIDRERSDVLFMEHWVFRYEVLPQGL
jgi:hypothetical protein